MNTGGLNQPGQGSATKPVAGTSSGVFQMRKATYIPPKTGKKTTNIKSMLKSRSKSIISHDHTVTDNGPKTHRVGANT